MWVIWEFLEVLVIFLAILGSRYVTEALCQFLTRVLSVSSGNIVLFYGTCYMEEAHVPLTCCMSVFHVMG